MRKEKGKEEKEKYFHVCGRMGIDFVIWLQERLGGMDSCVLVDCSKTKSLNKYIRRRRIKCKIILLGEMLMDVYSSEYVIFYHEQEDSFIDSYPGIHFFFIQMYDLEYVNSVLSKLTNGRICLFENTLVPQLGGWGKIYVLSLHNKKVTGEKIIYCSQAGARDNQEQVYSEIFDKGRGK